MISCRVQGFMEVTLIVIPGEMEYSQLLVNIYTERTAESYCLLLVLVYVGYSLFRVPFVTIVKKDCRIL